MDPFTIGILLVVGCSLLLSGCGDSKKENEKASTGNWEPQPEENTEETLGNDSNDGPANNYMQIKCTAAGDEICKLLNTTGDQVQGGTEAIDVDTNIEKFTVCEAAIDKKCAPDIEGNEWQCTNSDHVSNGCNTVDCTSFMFCIYGFGIIYIDDGGQKAGEMSAFGAFYVMELWLKEGYGTVPKEKLDQALESARIYGGQSQVKRIASGEFSQLDKGQFDISILAWTNFWNNRMDNKYSSEGKTFTKINAETIKIMMAIESTYGTAVTKNGTRNVMQSLVPGDPCFWAVTNKDPMEKGKSHYGTSEYIIMVTDLNGKQVPASMYHSGTPSKKEYGWFDNGNWKVFDPILTVESKGQYAGEYHAHYDEVTPDMSITVGIGWYAYKLNEEKQRSIEDAAYAYNGGGDPDYLNKYKKIEGTLK